MKGFDNIESYLLGELSPQDATTFEKYLQESEALRQETAFQKGIIEGIQQSRKSALKARLNALEVPAASTPSYGKWGIAAGVAIISAVLLWFAVGQSEPEELVKDNSHNTITHVPQPAQVEEEPVVKEVESANQPATPKETTGAVTSKKEKPQSLKKQQTVTVKKSKKKETIQELPKASFDYKVHYQYDGNVLTLFEEVPYQVIKADIGDGPKSYLKIEEHFFELKEDNTISEISESMIKDKHKIELLRNK